MLWRARLISIGSVSTAGQIGLFSVRFEAERGYYEEHRGACVLITETRRNSQRWQMWGISTWQSSQDLTLHGHPSSSDTVMWAAKSRLSVGRFHFYVQNIFSFWYAICRCRFSRNNWFQSFFLFLAEGFIASGWTNFHCLLCFLPPASSSVVPVPGTFSWPLAPRGKPRRGMLRRAVFSDLQRKALERTFQKQKYISKPDRKKLASKLGLKDSQVQRKAEVEAGARDCYDCPLGWRSKHASSFIQIQHSTFRLSERS